MKENLRNAIKSLPITLTICLGQTQCPEPSKPKTLIEEAHSSAIGGHEGVTKTFKRLRQR